MTFFLSKKNTFKAISQLPLWVSILSKIAHVATGTVYNGTHIFCAGSLLTYELQ